MISKEGAIKKFVEQYDMEVPQELVEEEYRFCVMNMKHQMRYAEMAGEMQMNPLEQRQAMMENDAELRAAALYNVKEELVIKDVIKKQDFRVTPEELQRYAEDMARRQDSTMEMVKKFFGEDLALLEGDVKRQKAEEWIWEQMQY